MLWRTLNKKLERIQEQLLGRGHVTLDQRHHVHCHNWYLTAPATEHFEICFTYWKKLGREYVCPVKKKRPSYFPNLVTIKLNWMLPLLANSCRPYHKAPLSLFERHSRNECNGLDGSVSLFVPYGREPSSTSRIIKISANEATALHMAVTRP